MMLVLVLCIAFASSFLVLNSAVSKMSTQNDASVWDQDTEYETFLNSKLGIPFLDNVFEEYLSGLGQSPFPSSDTIALNSDLIQI